MGATPPAFPREPQGLLRELLGLGWSLLVNQPVRRAEQPVSWKVIGLTVEQFLKKKFGQEVFLASVGYVLPLELRPEMRWLCQLNEICMQDVLICTLTPLGNSVRFHVHRTQVVKNIGPRRHELKVGLGIDQWFQSDGDSRILKFSFVSETQTWSHTGEVRKIDFGITLPIEVPIVSLEKDKDVTIISEFEEIYSRNGYFHLHMKYATSGARVTVNCQDDNLGIYVQFASREESQALRVGNDYVCPFTLLPYQRMAVRFWDKSQSLAWRSTNESSL
jgi:hypothetical protein